MPYTHSGIIHDRIDKMAQDLLADVAAPSSEGQCVG